MTEQLSVRIVLMDAQVVDCDGLPIGRIDDLEFRVPADGRPPEVERVLTGAQALGERIDGTIGRRMASISRRLRGPGSSGAPSSFDPALIVATEPMVQLQVRADQLENVAGLEHWLASRLVDRLPGSGRARK